MYAIPFIIFATDAALCHYSTGNRCSSREIAENMPENVYEFKPTILPSVYLVPQFQTKQFLNFIMREHLKGGIRMHKRSDKTASVLFRISV